MIAWCGYLFTGKEAMGGGDIKLLALIGLFAGIKLTLLTIFFGKLVWNGDQRASHPVWQKNEAAAHSVRTVHLRRGIHRLFMGRPDDRMVRPIIFL